mgnify:CR=1 FL=1
MKTLPLLTAALLAGGLITHAQDWTQWGGSQHRNMFNPAKGLPDKFDKARLDVRYSAPDKLRLTTKIGGGLIEIGRKDVRAGIFGSILC